MEKLFTLNGLTEDVVNTLLEHSGYETKSGEDALIYESKGNLFELSQEFVEKYGTYFVPVKDMSDILFESVKSNADPIRCIDIEGIGVLTLSEEIEEVDGEYMVRLLSEDNSEDWDEDYDEDEDIELVINEETYDVVEEGEATSYVYLSEDSDGDFTVVDSEDDSDLTVYLKDKE